MATRGNAIKLIVAGATAIAAIAGVLTSDLWGPPICRAIDMCDPAAGQGPPQTSQVNVPGSQPWTDTNLFIKAGNSVSIKANGYVSYNGEAPTLYSATPDGAPSCITTEAEGFIAPGLPCVALVGKIGNNGTPFLVGSNKTFPAQESGNLILGMNDKQGWFFDNSGIWSATIEVREP